MNVSEKEVQKSIKLVQKYNRLVYKHESIIKSYYKNLNTKIDYSVSVDPKFDSVKVHDLELNVYTYNILKDKTNIRTLGDLIRTNPWDLFKVRGLGKDRLYKIEYMLEEDYGIRWFQSHGLERGR